MKIGGLQKFSLIDYPGKTAAIIFTIGCNFRCKYCHNPELIIPGKCRSNIELSEVYNFLETRKGKLDAVCITGGEPTLHKDLPEVAEKIKEMGFLLKLDSNGTNPEMLKHLINKKLIDYIAMDIKAPLEDYAKIINCQIPAEKIKESTDLIISSGINHEFRTTIVKSLTSKNDLKKIAQTIKGAKNYYLQKFIPSKIYDPNLREETSYSGEELLNLSRELQVFVKKCSVR